MTFQDFLKEWDNDKDSINVYTSGSTGEPKKMELLKEFVKESAQRTNTFFNINSKSRLHSCVSPDFIGGKMMAVRAKIANSLFSWEDPSNEPLKNFPSDSIIDLLAVVPSQIIYILNNLSSLPKINNIIIGGSAIHPDLKIKIANSGLNAFETYGMTETASHIALRPITKENVPFKLFPGIKISLDNESCLKIIFKTGYIVRTNDIAEIISKDEFYIKGRRDDIIISGGRKVNPIVIETKIEKLVPSPFYITGFPDEKWGEKIVMVVEGPSFDKEKLLLQMKNYLEKWEIPKEINFVDKLPLTPNGKIIRVKNQFLSD